MGCRLQARRDHFERRALLRLTVSYLAVFSLVIVTLSYVAYALVEANYRSMVAPALDTPEGRAGLAAAMRPALLAIVSFDGVLLLLVGAAAYLLARAALRPLVYAHEREQRFAADVAHELRTPLAAIASVAQAVETGDPSARRALATVATRALECGILVGDLLTLARKSDAAALERELVDLAIVAGRAVRELEARRLDLIVDAACTSAIVNADERRLRQLITNLLENAAHYARTRITVRVRAQGSSAILCVDDDGPGVAAELAPHAFERFVRGDNSSGSGLGLAIGRWVARAHGGDLAHLGGARFETRLPLADIPQTS